MSERHASEAGLDLHACDREPIHVPGAIQPHGLLIVLDEPALTVVQVSANAADLTGFAPEALLGHDVAHLLGEAGKTQVRTAAAEVQREGESSSFLVQLPARPEPLWMAVLHRNSAGLVVELEPALEKLTDVAPYLYAAVERLREAESTQALCEQAACEIRHLTGFDRVKVYEFDPDWHGHVVAETRADHMDAYLDLHFPATDIPAQARRLYTLNRTRLIADAGYAPVPLVPDVHPRTGHRLDMTHSVLRSVSPIHIEYLKNMGVGASMSVSVIIDGQLWGLIACHHATPHFVPHQVRMACALLAQVLALLLTGRQEHEDRAHLARRKALQGRLLEAMMQADNFVQGLQANGQDLLDLMEAQGVVVYGNEVRIAFGEVPSGDALPGLVRWLEPKLQDGPFATDTLPRLYEPAEAFRETGSGLLAVSLSRLRVNFSAIAELLVP